MVAIESLVSKFVGTLRRRVRLIFILAVDIGLPVSKLMGKLRSSTRLLSILVVAIEFLVSQFVGNFGVILDFASWVGFINDYS